MTQQFSQKATKLRGCYPGPLTSFRHEQLSSLDRLLCQIFVRKEIADIYVNKTFKRGHQNLLILLTNIFKVYISIYVVQINFEK